MGLVINAPNVHCGGGLSLLVAILDALDKNFQGSLILDERLDFPVGFPDSIHVHRVRPTLIGRLLGEWRLRRLAGADDVVLCFGNLPPLFHLRARVVLFIQNRYQIERQSLKGFSILVRLKIACERFWFGWGKNRINRFIVQTPSMQRAARKHLGKHSEILPFSKDPKGYRRAWGSLKSPNNSTYDFAYIASGDPHKNHHCLIEAWRLLAEEGIRPTLCLTIDKKHFSRLCTWIDIINKDFELNIHNAGEISPAQIHSLYRETKALIFPSSFESLGLPLIEARCAGLPILASEMDYVRDVIDPEQTFDPHSPVSIARAVKRFMGIPESSLPLMDARTFLSKIYDIHPT